MKKIMILFAVAMLLLGVSGQAMAAFTTGDLIRVVYGNGNEYVSDLGNFSSLTSAGSGNVVSSDYINFSTFGGATNDQLKVAYFMYTSTAQGDAANYAWTSGISPTGQWSGSGKWAAFNSAAGYILAQASGSTSGSDATIASGNLNSYETRMQTSGTMSSFLNTATHPGTGSDQSLTTAGYVDQYLYYYSTPNSAKAGLQVATIRTFADGHTELNPTPIPATFLLFGSGLLGLVGIRRKQTV
jgi:hypothetical protein